MSKGYICDRCERKIREENQGAGFLVCGVQIRARFMSQGRYEGRRWLHACMDCWWEMTKLKENRA